LGDYPTPVRAADRPRDVVPARPAMVPFVPRLPCRLGGRSVRASGRRQEEFVAAGEPIGRVNFGREVGRSGPGEGTSGRRPEALVKTARLRLVLATMRAGADLAEQRAPGPITIQALRGRFAVGAEGGTWEVGPVELLAQTPRAMSLAGNSTPVSRRSWAGAVFAALARSGRRDGPGDPLTPCLATTTRSTASAIRRSRFCSGEARRKRNWAAASTRDPSIAPSAPVPRPSFSGRRSVTRPDAGRDGCGDRERGDADARRSRSRRGRNGAPSDHRLVVNSSIRRSVSGEGRACACSRRTRRQSSKTCRAWAAFPPAARARIRSR